MSESTQTQQQPPIHPGTVGQVVHTEWASRDPAASRAFLTDVFGTEFMDMSNPAGEYWTFGNMDLGIGGAIRPIMPQEPGPNATPYLRCHDIDETIAKAEAAGAKVIVPKMPVPNMGWFAWFQAPGDIVLAAWQNDANAPAPQAPPS